jgi:CRISP-associated protein Cas1
VGRSVTNVEPPSQADGLIWAERCSHWLGVPTALKRRGPPPRREHVPLVLTGHGMYLCVHHGALVVRNGFTHYPQQAEEYRFFRGDRTLPSRIILIDGSGTLSFDVLSWLSEQNVPLIRINWRGEFQAVLSATGYAADERKVAQQLEWKRNRGDIEFSKRLIDQKIANSIQTLKQSLRGKAWLEFSIAQLLGAREKLHSKNHKSVNSIRGIEGEAAIAYFNAWQGLPIQWRGTGRRPIPPAWHSVGIRSSYARKRIENRNASHPVNAMLNYAYAILQSQVQIDIISAGYDPTIGFLHAHGPERPAFVFDLMEPLRPIADRKILAFVQSHTFHPADFTIRADGVCRLNPEMARRVVTALDSPPDHGCLVTTRGL